MPTNYVWARLLLAALVVLMIAVLALITIPDVAARFWAEVREWF